MATRQYQLEYLFGNVPQGRLWQKLTTETGLNEWITGSVKITPEREVLFRWSEHPGDEARAKMEVVSAGNQVRFAWLDSDLYFDLSIAPSELTKNLSLIITDHADEDELDAYQEIWHQQVSLLRQALGLSQ